MLYGALLLNVCFPVPTATIIGGPDIYVNYGSTINLTCTIRHSPEPPAYIFWYYSRQESNSSSGYPSTKGPVRVIYTRFYYSVCLENSRLFSLLLRDMCTFDRVLIMVAMCIAGGELRLWTGGRQYHHRQRWRHHKQTIDHQRFKVGRRSLLL